MIKISREDNINGVYMGNVYSNLNAKAEPLQLVSFKIGDEEYGVNILMVRQINKMTAINKAANTPDFIEGEIDVNGTTVPVINLRTRLQYPKKDYDKDTKIIIVELNKKIVGFIVDSVSEVLRIDISAMNGTTGDISSFDSDYIKSRVKFDNRLLIMIDLNKILFKAIMEKLNETIA